MTVNFFPHSPHMEIDPGARLSYLPGFGPSGTPATRKFSRSSSLPSCFFCFLAGPPFWPFLRLPVSISTVTVAEVDAAAEVDASALPSVASVAAGTGATGA